MRRAIPVVTATAGGLALIASFHTHAVSTQLAAAGPTSTVPAPSPTAPPTTAATLPTTSSTARRAVTITGRSPLTTRPGSATSSSSTTTSTRSFDGPVATNEYGDVQVRITVAGSRITDVLALKMPNERARSARISQYAGPQLRSEALQAQSANIDIVSGASYTSQSYMESLQGAIDLSHQ